MKKYAALFLSLLLALSLLGCSANTEAPTPGQTTAQSTTPTTTTTTTAPAQPVDAVKEGIVRFEVPKTVFEEGTTVTAETVVSGEVYQRAETAVSPVARQFTVYEFNAVKDNVRVQPNGTLSVTFQIPENYSTNAAVYYVAEDGTSEKLEATVDAVSRTVIAQLSHFSTYVLVDLGEAAVTTEATTAEETTAATTAVPTTAAPTTKAPVTQAQTTATQAATTAVQATTLPVATTTTTTTTTAAPTTTTTKAWASALTGQWSALVVAGDDIKGYDLMPEEKACGESVGSKALLMAGSQEALDQMLKEEPDMFFEYAGELWSWGAGGFEEDIAYAENGKTVTVTWPNGGKLVLNRESENTLKVTANTTEYFAVPVGTVFTKL